MNIEIEALKKTLTKYENNNGKQNSNEEKLLEIIILLKNRINEIEQT